MGYFEIAPLGTLREKEESTNTVIQIFLFENNNTYAL